MTPAEFWDLTPVEFIPYIQERIKWQEQENKMENERFGLIAATMRNAFRSKGDKIVQPSDFFVSVKQESKQQSKRSRIEQFYNGMMAWCRGGKR